MKDPETPRRGTHKIFLGYASGVGKTHSMLEEARRRVLRGQDVVVGIVETRGRKPVEDLMVGLDKISTKAANGQPGLDVDAVLARKPKVVLVDDLHCRNAPGSPNNQRWQDVDALLEAGIKVLSTMNVQHLESLNDDIAAITGAVVADTVPDQVLRDATEVEYVDLTPQALLNRLDRGDIFPLDRLSSDIAIFYNEVKLAALREIAMREAASTVDAHLAQYRNEQQAEGPWQTQDRVMICISPTRSALRLIRRGWRMGQRMHGEVLAVHVEEGPTGERERKILEDDFRLAERLGIKTFVLKGELAPVLIEFAMERNVTQLILGHPQRNRIQEVLKPTVLTDLVKGLRTVDIMVVSTELPTATET